MPNIIRQIDVCGHVTFQNRLYMGGHLFKINSQYEFDRIVWLEIGCGCNGTKVSHVKHYGVCVSGDVLFVEDKYVVETNTAIPEESQDFDVARRDQHLNPGTDFDSIVSKPSPGAIWEAVEKQSKDRYKH
jgi:hypothetical protein